MERVHYSAIQDRFTHIDATFVACRLGFPDDDAFYAVRFYPWWEHPAYLEAARRQSRRWSFPDSEAGAQEVRVYPRRLIAFQISADASHTDWSFTRSGPRLWRFEAAGQVFVNDPVEREALLDDVAARLRVSRDELAPWLAMREGWTAKPPFSCRLPLTVLDAVCAALDARGVGHLVTHRPEPTAPPPVALVIDDQNYIVAEDFELDIPTFEHRPEWFVAGD